MSLLAWWKLDGNLLDSSGNEKHGTLASGSAVSFLDDGVPMAKSANFSTGVSVVEVPKDTIPVGTGDIAISYWYKGVAPVQSAILSALITINSVDSYQLNILPRWTGDMMYCDIGANDTNVYDRFSFATNDTFLGWNHFVIVKNFSKGTIKVYKNGILFAEGSGYTKHIGRVDKFYLGSRLGVNISLPSNLQDLRIYDHVLSLREISELAKAKVLHYTFDDVVDEPTVNLTIGKTIENTSSLLTTFLINLNGESTIGSATNSTINNFASARFDVATTIGKPYAISFKFKVSKGEVTGVRIHRRGGNISPSKLTDLGDGWYFAELVYVATDATTNFGVGVFSVNEMLVVFKELQVEEKDHVTDYVNGTRSSGVVKDKSDYSNNAAIDVATAPAFVEADCRLGKQSIKLATKKRIVEPLVLNPKPMTISFWFKANGLSSVKKGAYVVSNPNASAYIFLGSPSGVPETSSISFSVLLGKTNTSYDFDMRILKGKEYYADNKWHNATIVIDGVDNRIYIDSVKEAVTFTFGSKTTLSGFCDTVCIGEHTGSSAGYEPEGVFVDDFRIYATVLSAEAIKDIYETRAFLDEKGLLVANRFELGNDTSLKVKENGDLVFSAISDSGVTDGLIAWYPLDGHARDVIGGNDGIVYGGANVVGGQMQKCYNFDGVDDYIELPNPSYFKLNDFSCNAWFNNTDYSTSSAIKKIISFTENGGWNIGLNDLSLSKLGLGTYDGAAYKIVGIKKALVGVGWNHVVCSYDSSNKKISFYLNGELKDSLTLTTGLIYSSTDSKLCIGAESGTGAKSDFYNGKIQDVRIYNRALTAAEVKINYEMSRPDGNSVMSVNNDILYVKSGISDKI